MNAKQAAWQRVKNHAYNEGWKAGMEGGKAMQKVADSLRYGRLKTVLREILEDEHEQRR